MTVENGYSEKRNKTGTVIFLKNHLLAFILAGAVILNGLCFSAPEVKAAEVSKQAEGAVLSDDGTTPSYFDYYSAYSGNEYPKRVYELSTENAVKFDNPAAAINNVEGRKAVMLNKSNKWSEWTVDIESDGNYPLAVEYYAPAADGKDILFSLSVDGAVPYTEAENFQLQRLWRDITDGSFKRDEQGNDIQPEQEEVLCYQTKSLENVEGLYSEPYFLYLSAGRHTIRITDVYNAVAVSVLRLGNSQSTPSYSEYIKRYSGKDAIENETVIQQAEMTYTKTGASLYPTYDRNDVETLPNEAGYLRLNTIGASNWYTVGDEITWKPDIKTAGLYKIAFRVRQNVNQGMNSYRSLSVNGTVPFAEAESIAFPYAQKWYIKTFGDESPYLVWLEPGDSVSLTCVAGVMSEPLRNIRQGLLDINALYREIIAVTSVEPDIYRDYSLSNQVTDLEERLKKLADFFLDTANRVSEITGTRGSSASSLDYMASMLNEFVKDPESIPERLSSFKNAINDVGSVLNTLGEGHLELDYIVFADENNEIPSGKASIAKRFSHWWQMFIHSFSDDYSYGKSTSGTVVNVWVATGRDQLQIIKNLISDKFTNNYGIQISLNMVDTSSTMIKAALAGKGPDAALFVANPMELAYRDAIVDLSKYEIGDLYGEFCEQTWLPYKYDGGIYALPETETFDVLFYRTDVLADLGLNVPKTWDELYKVMEILQKNQLMVGIPEIDSSNMGVSTGIGTFYRFMLQSGEKYYNDSLTAVNFDSETGFQAFKRWVQLYRDFGLSRQYDFYSRFRMGDMPMAIQSYTSYNQLMRAAPELKGLWSFAAVPGTKKADGSIDISENATFSGCIMMKSAVKKGIDKETFTFLKWWASGETQLEYAKKLEDTMGVAARYTPANLKALRGLAWSEEELDTLIKQMSAVRAMESVPGNYLIGRSLTTAFRSAVSGSSSIRQALTVSVKNINDEITKKSKEFNFAQGRQEDK